MPGDSGLARAETPASPGASILPFHRRCLWFGEASAESQSPPETLVLLGAETPVHTGDSGL